MERTEIFKLIMFLTLVLTGLIYSYLIIYGYPKANEPIEFNRINCYDSKGNMLASYIEHYEFPKDLPVYTLEKIKYCELDTRNK